jgi:transcriptional regulator with XRE-family HTH domain
MTNGATWLAEFLRRNNLTQLATAEALGVSDPTVHDWVTGSKRPKAHHRDAISVWTRGEVPVDAWLEESERVARAAVKPFDRESGPSVAEATAPKAESAA